MMLSPNSTRVEGPAFAYRMKAARQSSVTVRMIVQNVGERFDVEFILATVDGYPAKWKARPLRAWRWR